MTIFNAKIFSGSVQLIQREGNDADNLYVWMVTRMQGEIGHFNGDVVNVLTGAKMKLSIQVVFNNLIQIEYNEKTLMMSVGDQYERN